MSRTAVFFFCARAHTQTVTEKVNHCGNRASNATQVAEKSTAQVRRSIGQKKFFRSQPVRPFSSWRKKRDSFRAAATGARRKIEDILRVSGQID